MGETTPDIEVLLRDAKSLEPADRLRIIARLWASLPQEYWPAPTPNEIDESKRLLSKHDIDNTEGVPWPIVEQVVRDCVRSSRPKVYSAPRRFDLATIFVVTTAYAILFAGLAALQIPPAINLITVAFITIVGIGQAFLFRGLRPRTSSLVVGMALYSVFIVGNYAMNSRVYPSTVFGYMLISGLVGGAVFGYLAGTLVGGVFLVADIARRRLSRTTSTPTMIDSAEESPTTRS